MKNLLITFILLTCFNFISPTSFNYSDNQHVQLQWKDKKIKLEESYFSTDNKNELFNENIEFYSFDAKNLVKQILHLPYGKKIQAIYEPYIFYIGTNGKLYAANMNTKKVIELLEHTWGREPKFYCNSDNYIYYSFDDKFYKLNVISNKNEEINIDFSTLINEKYAKTLKGDTNKSLGCIIDYLDDSGIYVTVHTNAEDETGFYTKSDLCKINWDMKTTILIEGVQCYGGDIGIVKYISDKYICILNGDSELIVLDKINPQKQVTYTCPSLIFNVSVKNNDIFVRYHLSRMTVFNENNPHGIEIEGKIYDSGDYHIQNNKVYYAVYEGIAENMVKDLQANFLTTFGRIFDSHRNVLLKQELQHAEDERLTSENVVRLIEYDLKSDKKREVYSFDNSSLAYIMCNNACKKYGSECLDNDIIFAAAQQKKDGYGICDVYAINLKTREKLIIGTIPNGGMVLNGELLTCNGKIYLFNDISEPKSSPSINR